MLSGGEQGARVKWTDGTRRLSIKNPNVLARALARTALAAFGRAPLPPPAGIIGPGGPNDPQFAQRRPGRSPARG